MDFIPGVNDNDGETKFCLFQGVDGETDAPDDKAMRPSAGLDQGAVSDQNYYDPDCGNQKTDARPTVGQ